MQSNLNKLSIQGKYYKQKSKLISENLILTICERKKPTPKKPPKYLLGKYQNTKDTFYVSSLYPCSSCGGYLIDFKGFEYVVTKGDEDSTILIKYT